MTRRPTRSRSLRVALVAAGALGIALAPAVAEAAPSDLAPSDVAPTAVDVARTSADDALVALHRWESSLDPADYLEFLQARDRAAAAAARELELPATDLVRSWAATQRTNQVALLAALTQLGVPYRSHASVEGEGFDCSGLTSYSYRRAGIELPRSSRDQMSHAPDISREQASAGDLVYYPGHVMLYLGVGDAIVHSPNSGNHVELTTISKRRSSNVRFADPTT